MSVLVCPDCRGALDPSGSLCSDCGAAWPHQDGFPKYFRERRVGRMDRFMRLFYNGLPALHDPLTTHFLPWLQRDSSEAAFRRGVLEQLALDELADREVVRILEVGVGAGANLQFLAAAMPRGPRVELWGLDLARGMLKQCRKRLPVPPLDVRLLLGDAHRLPFADDAFDRVFHIGAVATFSDPAAALAEMARVARAGTPIVVADEQLDPTRDNTVRDKIAFRALTFYDTDPKAPSEHLPRGAQDVQTVQLSRFLYCLRFRVPPPDRPAAPSHRSPPRPPA